MTRLITCTRCGRVSERTPCSVCQPTKSDPRSLAQYRKARETILANNPLCFWCKVALATTADHLVPVVSGGTDDVSNLVPACETCNKKRGAKSAHRAQVPVPEEKRSLRLT
jgi:5-methylcytosine-specific restriction endonuclease McrA